MRGSGIKPFFITLLPNQGTARDSAIPQDADSLRIQDVERSDKNAE